MLTRTNVIFQHSQTICWWSRGGRRVHAIFPRRSASRKTISRKFWLYSTVSQLGFMFLACGVGPFTIRNLSRDDPRVFQSADVLGAGSATRHASRQDISGAWQSPQVHAVHVLTFLGRWLPIAASFRSAASGRKTKILCALLQRRPYRIGWLLWIVGTIAATCTGVLYSWSRMTFGEREIVFA